MNRHIQLGVTLIRIIHTLQTKSAPNLSFLLFIEIVSSTFKGSKKKPQSSKEAPSTEAGSEVPKQEGREESDTLFHTIVPHTAFVIPNKERQVIHFIVVASL
mmetsp:Transcript_39691/g.95791  ORF Transcript_39691/g.95791 Transcript_39691/m.95791 type:complete len:102 (+) Transcript_39691:54-359(+)